jgi:predicted SprT family Zn-dependent metalloprotease
MARKIGKQSSSYEGKKHREITPTSVVYDSFQQAYDFFNARLFADCHLPTEFVITMARHSGSKGHFADDRYTSRDTSRDGKDRIAEINLNPDAFTGRTDEEILSTLVHEMVHWWQSVYGTKPSHGYHNKQWAAKMKQIGLHPGMVGGKENGKHVTHYIVAGGPYAEAYADLAATGFELHWQSTEEDKTEKAKRGKTKFTCPACNQNAWGKPDLQIRCRAVTQGKPCNTDMVSAETASYEEIKDAA